MGTFFQKSAREAFLSKMGTFFQKSARVVAPEITSNKSATTQAEF
jgi:hypothetical protein